MEELVKLLTKLIKIPSPSGKEEKILKFIERYLSFLKFEKVFVEERRYDLLYKNDSPLVISIHVDTVPKINFKEAFKPKVEGDRIYGRGTSDVKGMLSCLLLALKNFYEKFGKIPVSLAFVVDEETNTALGSELALKHLKDKEMFLVIEPTYGKVCIAQEGSLEFSITCKGESAHASEFDRVENPIKTLFKVLESLEGLLKRPVNIIKLSGGSQFYLTPWESYALLELKLYEGEKVEDMEKKIISLLPKNCQYKREDAEEFIRFRCERFVKLFDLVLGSYETSVMRSWTDASNYHKGGKEVVVFGYGSLKESHTDRESITLEELKKGYEFFFKLFKRLLSPKAL